MVICTGCNKPFKKLHGLSLHRNKCQGSLSGSSFEKSLSDSRSFKKKTFALKFRKRQDSEGMQLSDSEEIGEPEVVSNFES
jgi:hypothetical protein